MPTRKQDPDCARFDQSGYSSSPEFERGILGNLVAARCQRLSDREEITMLWWLQQVSWREGGLERFARDFLKAYDYLVARFDYDCSIFSDDPPAPDIRAGIECREFTEVLNRALVDPQTPSLREGHTFFRKLWNALTEWREKEIAAGIGRMVETEVSKQIFEELDFAAETRSFLLIEGREGIGKTEAALAWCRQRPGQAIHVRLESGSDETTLYRSIAREIGTACSYARKAVEMRARIQDALQPGHLMLVIDEAHFLWPQSDRSERTTPKRVDWLRTALVDFNVPVALVSTPQFFARQCDRFRKAGWNANQIQRRLIRTVQLPETLRAEDALAVARSYFPHLSAKELTIAAGTSMLTIDGLPGNLARIDHLRKRVDFLKKRRPGAAEAALVREILDELVQPVSAAPAEPARGHKRPAAKPVQAACRGVAEPISGREIAPNRIGILNAQPSEVSTV